MMSVYQRHFRVDSGELIEHIEAIKTQRAQCGEVLSTLLPEFGAKEAKFWKDGSFAAFVFTSDPDLAVYRRTQHGWVPKKNCAAGKAIWEKIKTLPSSPNYQNALAGVGLKSDVPCLIDDSRGIGYYPVMGGFPGKKIWFVQVPWRDVSPKEMAEYIAENEAGNRCCHAMEHLRWTPPAEWVEIKEWQYLKEWEELSQETT